MNLNEKDKQLPFQLVSCDLHHRIHFLIFESYELIFMVFVEACCNFNDKGQLGKWDSVGARNAFDFVYAKSLVVHSSCSSSSVLKETRRSWEEKLEEATRDGKIVSPFTFYPPICIECPSFCVPHCFQTCFQQLVANFSAPWSAPCKSIAPTYGELADKYNSLIFLTVDVDALAEFSNSWEISATPTFFFIKEGKQVDKFVGADNVELKKKIAAVAANKA
ncbi:hypothetical protein V6N12_063462 [Hibiscus sabdariffa]|uniref:Thioredoxin domain-containing protein n=1 Tax=Hibiscus sabdariffa TaxID=183260 RepID=A0ABR2FBY8_9ROSI